MRVEDTDVRYCNLCGKTWGEPESNVAVQSEEITISGGETNEPLELTEVAAFDHVAEPTLTAPAPPLVMGTGLEATEWSAQDAKKVGSLLDFLEAFYRISRPPIRDIRQYDEFLLREQDLPSTPGIYLSPAGDTWLSTRLVDHEKAPEVPPSLAHLLGPLSPHTRPIVELDDEASDEEFQAAVELDQWINDVWEPWSLRWQDAEKSRSFYKQLYAVRTRLESEGGSFELIWGFGRLRWSTPQGEIDHPLITVPVEMHLNTADGVLSVEPTAAATIESGFLSEVDLADRGTFISLREEGAAEDLDLWSDSRSDLLQQLLRFLDHDGVFDEGNSTDEHAIVVNHWVLYLRRRLPDYVGFLQRLRELYQNGISPPLPFLSLVVDEPSRLASAEDVVVTTDPSFENAEPTDNTLYLPKPANEEQFRILRHAQTHAGVTAQGPPGTGKSHTIANLICHFVAQGKRVLVTAEKEQALSVLTGQLPPAVRELSVSVLGGDQASRMQMERAINVIGAKVATYDGANTEAEITRLETEISVIDASIAKAGNELRAARSAEVTTIAGSYEAGRDPSPSRVAAWLNETEQELSFIGDRIELGKPMPLVEAEWIEFTQLVGELSNDDVTACRAIRPELERLRQGSDLEAQFSDLNTLRNQLADLEGIVQQWMKVDNAPPDVIAQLTSWVEQVVGWRMKWAGTWLERVVDECETPVVRDQWRELVDSTRQCRDAAVSARRALAAYQVGVPVDPDPEITAGLRDARERFAAGKGVSSRFQKKTARALQACSVNGRTPQSVEQVDLCLAAVAYHEYQLRLRNLWANSMPRIGGPSFPVDELPEDAVGDWLDEVLYATQWYSDIWPSLGLKLSEFEIQGPADSSPGQLEQFVDRLQLIGLRTRERELSMELDRYQAWLEAGASSNESPLWGQLLSALRQRSWTEWDRLVAEVSRLAALQGRVDQYVVLDGRLHPSAPTFAREVSTHFAVVPSYELMTRAWQWKQLDVWLQALSGGPASPDLQRMLEDLAKRRLRVMEDLVAARAWRGLKVGFTDKKRAALNKFVTAVKRFGKTGGKYKDRWLREQREALDEAKDAVPVLVMPASRVLSSFHPEADAPFDVVIIDESSQLGIVDVPILALGKKSIVVGDDKQTSPANVGLDQSVVFELIEGHLKGIKDRVALFNSQNSLYDISHHKFPDLVVLLEHFRCLPAIIEFSNGRYYGGSMVPLRDRPPNPGWQPVGTVFVPDGFRDGRDINEPEALAVVELIEELCADPQYEGMSFGVVTLLGTAQAPRVQDLLLDRLGPEVMEERQIRCGQAPAFQGDERDVVILSMVADKTEGRRVAAMTSVQAEQALNVAATRAKNQMWAVHSIQPEDFPTGDPRAALIQYCQNPTALEVVYANLEERCDSQFERDVLKRILARGYTRVRTQHAVGGYRIDIVIEGPESRLAVECDGDAWHTEHTWEADRTRQMKLERARWTFERIRGSSFYRDPERALEPLWTRLEELEIPTGDWASGTGQLHTSTRRIARTMAERSVFAKADEEEPTDRADAAPSSPSDPIELVDLERPSSAEELIEGADSESVSQDAVDHLLQLEGPISSEASTEAQLPLVVNSAIDGIRQSPVTDDLATHSRLASRSAQRPRPPGATLAPYTHWEQRSLSSVLDGAEDRVVADLLEIVSVEGPMQALFLYQIHAKAAGGHRVGREMRHRYNRLVSRAIRAGDLSQIDDDIEGVINKTVYLPQSPEVVIRELGPRQLIEVPRSEVASLSQAVQGASVDATKRAVLDALGLIRMRQRTSEYLDECLSYYWRSSSGAR